MEEKTLETAWSSCDMKQVAFLLYAGYGVLDISLEQGRVYFKFEDTAARRAALLAFWNKEQRVEPVAFLDCLNRARDMVAQALRK